MLEEKFSRVEGLTLNLFKKRIDRIMWELASFVTYDELRNSVQEMTQ